MLRPIVAFATCMLLSCSSETAAPTPEEEWIPGGPTLTVTLPDGAEIEAVLRMTEEERNLGMMFRHHLPVDKGMLFVFQDYKQNGFWMFNTPVPLDIVWMDGAKRIVEIYENATLCPERDFRNCPTFGGAQPSVYVIELAAGQVVARGLKLGDELIF